MSINFKLKLDDFSVFRVINYAVFVPELYFENELSQCLLKLADMEELYVAALVRFSVVLRCRVCLCDVVSKPAVMCWKRVCQAVYDDALRKPVSAADV